MANHSCGINGYVGVERSETPGVFGLFWGFVIARLKAYLRAQAVYDRDCPDNCDDDKNGLMSFKVIETRFTRVPVSPQPGVRQRFGWLVRVKWRLWTSCMSTEAGGVVKDDPVVLPWGDLEVLFGEHYGESNLDQIDQHLEGIGSNK